MESNKFDPKHVLGLQLAWIERSDSKIFFLVSVCLAMMGSLVALLGEKDLADIQFKVAVVLYFILSGVSLASGIHATFPRLKGPDRSNIYFGGISNQSAGDYKANVISLSAEQNMKDEIDQIHVNACIASRKYESVKFSFQLFGFSVPFWFLSIYGAS